MPQQLGRIAAAGDARLQAHRAAGVLRLPDERTAPRLAGLRGHPGAVALAAVSHAATHAPHRKSVGPSDTREAPVMIDEPSRTRTLDPLIKKPSEIGRA